MSTMHSSHRDKKRRTYVIFANGTDLLQCIETYYAKSKANIRGRPGTSNYGTESDYYPLKEIEETPANQTMERALQTDFFKAEGGSHAPVEDCSKGIAGERIKHFPATSFWGLIDRCQTRPTMGHVSPYEVAKAALQYVLTCFFLKHKGQYLTRLGEKIK